MAEGSSKSCPFGGSLALDDPEVVEVSAEVAAGWSSRRQKRKRTQVVPHDIIQLDDDDDPDGVTIIGEKTSDHKNKQVVGYPMDWPKKAKSGLAEDIAGPSAIPAQTVYPWNGLGAYHGGAMLPVYFDNSFEAFEEEDYAYDEEEYDNYSYNTLPMESGSSVNLYANYYMGFSPGVGAVLPWGHMTPAEMPHQHQQIKVVDSEIDEKYKAFKQFDTVGDHSDHFYSMPGKRNVQAVKKPSKAWVKRIQHEWKVLEKDLPDTIFVRVYEDRMDLLRAVIVGPAGTPYHDGLFFFDVYFPSQYPSKPPLVNYRSGGLRLNPNLYACGKVCLSLLNTWSGSGCEKWNPSNSTMLQVLVSIQALVLNAKPYFNEPGYVMHANTPHGEKMSLAYNEETFLLSCRTMLYSLRNPPKHFEDFIGGHFRKYGHNILIGCKAYMGGAQVGCLVGDGVQDVDEGDRSCSENFKGSLKKLFEDLMTEFTHIGVDCGEFQPRIVNPGAATATADTTLRL